MQWDYLFSNEILKRGQQYYKQGRVQGLIKRGATYQAKVIGSKIYHVEIYASNPVLPRTYCSCPYAADGGTCKHIAAVIYAIEAQKVPSKTQSGARDTGNNAVVVTEKAGGTAITPKKENNIRVYPFRKTAAQKKQAGYQYFDLERMTEELIFRKKVVQKAQKLVEEHAFKDSSVKTGYPNRNGVTHMIGEFWGYLDEEKIKSVIVQFDKDEILTCTCRVPGCYRQYRSGTLQGYYGYYRSRGEEEKSVCVHGVAALMLLDDYLEKHHIGDATDNYGQWMLQEFRSMRAWKQAENTEEITDLVHLELQCERDLYGFYATFKVGRDKLYVIKNLTEFVCHVEEHDKHPLGTKHELDFATARIAEDSRKYYDFVRGVVMEEQSRSAYANEYGRSVYDDSELIKNRIPLYGKRLDLFFELVNGGEYPLTDKAGYRSQKSTLRFGEKDPKITLSVGKQADADGTFQGVLLSGTLPEIIRGMDYQYFYKNHTLNRISAERSHQMVALYEIADYDNKIEVRIGRKNLSEFCYRILPMLKEYATVIEKDLPVIQEYLPPEAEFVFLLDADHRNITCKALANYGETQCNLIDWRMGDVKKEDFRDVQRESEVLTRVEQLFPEKDWDNGLFHCGEDADAMYVFLESGVSALMEMGEVKSTDKFRKLRVHKSIPVTVGVAVKSDIMNLEISSTDLTQEELLDILKQYRKKKKYYRLRNGDFLNLEENNLQELSTMLDVMHISPKDFTQGKMQIPLYRALYLDKMLEQSEGFYTNRDKNFKQLVKNFKTVEDADYAVPETLQNVMRKYQKYGYRWLRTLESCGFGGILADDMGLGKTLQVIAVLLAASKEEPALIITPASLVYNWQEECARFAPKLRVQAITGSQENRRQLIAQYQDYDVLVTSYDLLKRDIAEYEDKNFSYEIIDEAQYIKNHTTAAAKSVKVINSRVRYALTGTPIENRLSELWSIFDYLMPGFLYGYDTFKKELETPITKNKDQDATARLKKMVSPFILRRLKGDVLKDLPDKLEEVVYAHMEEKQQRLYDGQVVHMQQILNGQTEEELSKNKLQILSELTKIRQICCDPELLMENYDGESAKRAACMELITSAIEGEHKILLFSQFTSMLELLEEDLKREHISYYKITGETAKEKRIELVRRFNEDDTPLFLISLKAGGTGLNLTGADVVIHYDPWWNLAVQNQATDRAHRIGQTKIVSVYKLIVKDSIEEKILHMQEAKKNLADETLSRENGGITDMTKEELIELLGV